MAQLQPNPSGATTILLVAAAVGGAWLVFRKKEPKTTTTTIITPPQTPSPKPPAPQPQPPNPPICKPTSTTVNQWGTENGFLVVWADKVTTTPPTLEALKQAIPEAAAWTGGDDKIVVVTNLANRFWNYDTNGNPVLSENLRNQFCFWNQVPTVNGLSSVYASIW